MLYVLFVLEFMKSAIYRGKPGVSQNVLLCA